jgi:hypothetical protein
MKVTPLGKHKVLVELSRSPSGYKFLLEEIDRPGSDESMLRVTVPDDRIMYGTEGGNNNAEYVLLIK